MKQQRRETDEIMRGTDVMRETDSIMWGKENIRVSKREI
jgi:hypothetical protein